MPTINELTSLDTILATDQVPLYSATNSDARKASISLLKTYFQNGLVENTFITQYAAPSTSGFSVDITDGSDNIWLILTPVADYAAGTIVLPAVANCADRQEILIISTKEITNLTIDGNGASVSGEPDGLTTDASVRFKYDLVMQNWYMAGTDVIDTANSLKSNSSTGKLQITGPGTGTTRVMTFPNANATVLTDNATVTVAQGGTGANTLTVNNVLLGNGTSALQVVAPSTSGNVLTSNGTTWVSSAPGNSAGVKSNSTTGIMQITGPAAGQTRVMTIPNANATLLTTNATVTVGQGGTGASSLTANNVILGNGTSAVQFVAPGTNKNVLQSNGTTWQSVALSGLTVSQGGTGAATFTANAVLLGNGTSAFQAVAAGSNGAVLQSNGTTWAAGSVIASAEWTPTATIVTNLDAVTIGKCRYQRIGSIVFVSGIVNIDLTADGVITFRLTLPIASNFAATTDASGCACLDITGTGYANLRINADTTNDALYFTGNADVGPFDLAFTAAYTII